jgi:sugar phosphate isomerase/epimerase
MKSGGVGYVQPDGDDFPKMEQVNEFAIQAGGFPMHTWLDGLSDGEQAIEELLDLAMSKGVAALNIIPDRNWNIADGPTREKKVAELHKVVEIANRRDLPVMVGTELNAHGQRFVDDFDTPEMAPLFDTFQRGAFILHAHTVLQSAAGLGYLSNWAAHHFDAVAAKNDFFAKVGEHVLYPDIVATGMIDDELAPDRVFEILTALDPTTV